MNKHLLYLTLIVFLLGCKQDKPVIENNESIEILFKKEGVLQLTNQGELIKEIDIEIADNESQRRNGLMNRSKMEENKGMLFIHDKVEPVYYWMRNTRIPLDIIYFSADTVVINIAKNATPYQEKDVESSSGDTKFVLEINGGLSDKWGVKEGVTKMSWESQQ